MKSKNHQDPIQQWADCLRDHSVPYREGAWEQFQSKNQPKKRKWVIWPYISAAAVMLLAITLFLLPKEQETKLAEVASIEQEQLPVLQEELPALSADPGTVEIISKQETRMASLNNNKRTTLEGAERQARGSVRAAGSTTEPVLLSVTETGKISLPVESQEAILIAQQDHSFPVGEHALEDATEEVLSANVSKAESRSELPSDQGQRTGKFLADLLKAEPQEQDQNQWNGNSSLANRKWSVGLNVSPNIGSSSQVNIGGGVALAYAISPKVSISSGVSYLQLDAERGVSNAGNQQLALSTDAGAVRINVENKTLEKVQANLAGLDIPLTLNYRLNERIFTTVGISVFGVLNENGSREYLNEMSEVSYLQSDARTPEPIVRTFYSKEATSEKLYEGKSVSGFFNFSVGYSIPLTKKVGFAIEPFVKIPMGYISPDELNLSNGGIKISTRF